MDASLARKALEKRFARLRPIDLFRRPAKGWVRAIRDALGMTAAQLAERMRITQPSVSALERDESQGTISLTRLERAAEALGCTLVYALVPNQPLDEMVLARARLRATRLLQRVDTTMTLEAQNLDSTELLAEGEELAAELIRGKLSLLWDEP